MMGNAKAYAVAILAALLAVIATQAETAPGYRELRRLPAQEARQGVATDARFVYAIEDSKIGKYDKVSGKRVALFEGDPKVFIHMNSCSVLAAELVCAMSNFPNLPMISSVEWFSTATMQHVRTHSFGPTSGSLTWIDWHDGAWWACFANYDNRGGDPARNHTATTLVKFNAQFVAEASWLFPENVLDKFGHMSASGGRWGRGGLLYVTGHDLPEMYVLRLPAAGARLEYVSTLSLPTGGQAFDWDRSKPGHLWTVERKESVLVESALPTGSPGSAVTGTLPPQN
ncbi:hypothetical protein Terro_3797 [Terriglobus roseus DSM 18391]|uniref:Uncharacterized protein n=1 Tax=Terriglobus roseus (strain DSM 18391 / NRRL B-41598 / KBS 63) TaxID=926566 RepID=I3ZL88_TERRK|nr:hypothetical protein [Terriglobus roseus]AFL90006.1 hypothetical protein Terro_3797 [Terriglobus roseus DSM 18391]